MTHAQGVSNVDMGASQVLHVHLEDRGISMEKQQEPWVPTHVLRCQGNSFPPDAKEVSPTGCKSEELGGGDAGVGTFQLRRKRFPTWNKSPQTLSQKGQSPESNKIKHYFQWRYPGIKCKQQETLRKRAALYHLHRAEAHLKVKLPLLG